ncbi:hypothetical protein UP10_28480 [Bradyrhizobium sp. LTSPM299]|nr:hypothetical protein UP10_28480 [Bradyrhizobium sp. LTSPM299]
MVAGRLDHAEASRQRPCGDHPATEGIVSAGVENDKSQTTSIFNRPHHLIERRCLKLDISGMLKPRVNRDEIIPTSNLDSVTSVIKYSLFRFFSDPRKSSYSSPKAVVV